MRAQIGVALLPGVPPRAGSTLHRRRERGHPEALAVRRQVCGIHHGGYGGHEAQVVERGREENIMNIHEVVER
jgi:hypothetical protein